MFHAIREAVNELERKWQVELNAVQNDVTQRDEVIARLEGERDNLKVELESAQHVVIEGATITVGELFQHYLQLREVVDHLSSGVIKFAVDGAKFELVELKDGLVAKAKGLLGRG
jgi:hypothetical protein